MANNPSQIQKEQLNGQAFLYSEMNWAENIIRKRLRESFKQGASAIDLKKVEPVSATDLSGPYAEFVSKNQLSMDERFLLILTLAPHVSPGFMDEIFLQELEQQGDFPQLGGVRGITNRGFQPTLETALFMLAGQDLQERIYIQRKFNSHEFFDGKRIVFLSMVKDGEPQSSGKLMMDQEYIDLFSLGVFTHPQFSAEFPAEWIQTDMEWDDLVLNAQTLAQIQHIEAWLKHQEELRTLSQRKFQEGYRVLFHGPPGTGKTLTASLLGKYTGRDVFKIDLSLVVSKYIGETEKNLASLFDKARDKEWILFFDEADALFGKRTQVNHAHDRFANQEVSFLLQRVQNYSGLVILATNFKSNIDEAFNRRFQMFIHFPMPRMQERMKLWQKSFPESFQLAEDINLQELAQNYELSGSNIVNIIQYACLKTLNRHSLTIEITEITEGIRNEMHKEGKVI